jgi:hypothetical protein
MDAPRLRSLLLRGSVVAAANWPAVVTQAIAGTVVKVLAGIPVAGAALLLLVIAVPDARSGTGAAREGAAAAISALATVPAALAGVAVSAIVAALGAIVFGAAIKAGTVSVIAAGEARTGPIATGRPLRIEDVARARAWSPARFVDGCARFGPRFVRLGIACAVLEGAVALAYATVVVQAYRAFVSVADSWWIAPAVLAVSMAALAVTIGADLVYRLAQLVLVIEDTSAGAAVRAAVAFVRHDALVVARICLAALVLTTLAFVITLIAAAAFGFVSFVPVAGVAVLPLQAAVWVVRGLMLPFIELAALAAYAAAYRRVEARPQASAPSTALWPVPRAEPRAVSAASPDRLPPDPPARDPASRASRAGEQAPSTALPASR